MGTGDSEPKKAQPLSEKASVKSTSCVDAWDILKNDVNAVLVDVRTVAEWSFVGGADLSSLNKNTIYIQWNVYPSMAVNENFVQQLESEATLQKDTNILFLCRSGARSLAAAQAMAANGYLNCYNVEDGFEGDLDVNGHRGQKNGWKFCDLPWGQK